MDFISFLGEIINYSFYDTGYLKLEYFPIYILLGCVSLYTKRPGYILLSILNGILISYYFQLNEIEGFIFFSITAYLCGCHAIIMSKKDRSKRENLTKETSNTPLCHINGE